MRDLLERIIKEPVLYLIYALGRILNGTLWLDKVYLKILFRFRIGKSLNLKKPKTYNEKVQWLKLYDRNPEYSKLVDKYEVRKYIAKTIGEEYLIPLLGVWKRFEDIDFNKLPNQFVLKCTHDSGGVIICKDKSTFDREAARKKLNRYLKRNYYINSREWVYKNIKPRIIAEKYIVGESGADLKDYKFMCYHGQPKTVDIISNRESDPRSDMFDINFKRLPVINYFKNSEQIINKPEDFEEMIRLCKVLSKDLIHVRCDFYDINGKVYFGEITFYQCSGLEKYEPYKYDVIFGSWIHLPIERKN
ncbi:ATP-grasp fold amidoligase family protein [Lachnoclostridium phytofermentans]|uniref:Glycosyltransferase n=1 Tax=Lachnoclostridium phytofermentans (strain ATCC 700394 / DSM 18823 / ISDg) TaxID=357809 RepID=A9KN84_LACP7|nr:ATP-grasp fold amidoligase family protein [Lachnoclostridium phytofermentans]ABX41583.1 glycosyltransferase [Lachnoclostridium phytofermentans ISDg]